MSEYILEMDNICKSFSGVQVLHHVNLKVRKGTLHALMGENGAGKSTLMKILIGAHRADSGTIRFNGEDLEPSTLTVHQALGKGTAALGATRSARPSRAIRITMRSIDPCHIESA